MLSQNRIRSDVQEYDCVHMGKPVIIKSMVVYPEGILRDMRPPRITSRECNHYADCHLGDKCACPVSAGHV